MSMAEEDQIPPHPFNPPPPKSSSQSDALPSPPLAPSSEPQPTFNPSRISSAPSGCAQCLPPVIGIIKRKALTKELAAAYHTECLALCREILELQKKKEEPFIETKPPEDLRKETLRSSK